MEPQTALAYIRSHVTMPGENFVKEWTRLTEQDKADVKRWASKEMRALDIPERV